VPTVPSFTQRLESAPEPRVRGTTGGATTATAGGGQPLRQVTEASQQLLGTIGEIALEQKNKADDLSVMEFNTANKKDLDKLWYDQKQGVLSRKAGDVKNSDFFGDFNKAKEAIYAKNQKLYLRSRDQVDLSKPHQMNSDAAFSGRLQNRFAGEIKKYELETRTSSISTSKERMAQNFHVKEIVLEEMETIKKEQKELAEFVGLSEEGAELSILQETSAANMGVLNSFINARMFTEARTHLAEHANEMTAKDKDSISGLLKTGTDIERNTAKADAIFAKARSQTEAEAMIQEVDPLDREDVGGRVRARYARINRAKENDDRKRYDYALELASANMDADNIPLSVWDRLSPEQQSKIETYTGMKRNGRNVTTKAATWFILNEMASTPNARDKFRRHDLNEDILDLSDFHRAHFKKLQDEANKESEKFLTQMNRFTNTDNYVEEILESNFLDDKSGNKLRRAEFVKSLTEWAESQPNYPSQTELRDHVDEMVIRVKNKGVDFVFQVDRDKLTKINYIDIPAKERIELTNNEKIKLGKHTLSSDDKKFIADLYSFNLKKKRKRGR